jgi:hypothetical protein
VKPNLFSTINLKLVGFTCLAGLLLAGFTQVVRPSTSALQQNPITLDVPVLRQMWSTSCGEAVIAMTYNFVNPEETPIKEAEIIEFASINGYYTEDKYPYTSPANMVRIAEHYTAHISTGTVMNSRQALALLMRHLRGGEPVIIDVLSNFSDPESEAHFIVVTGVSVNAQRNNTVVIHYNDPLTGTKESADWEGSQGVWNAWRTNDDPGGPGWWMVISPG